MGGVYKQILLLPGVFLFSMIYPITVSSGRINFSPLTSKAGKNAAFYLGSSCLSQPEMRCALRWKGTEITSHPVQLTSFKTDSLFLPVFDAPLRLFSIFSPNLYVISHGRDDLIQVSILLTELELLFFWQVFFFNDTCQTRKS